jgi:hypothetical protein
MEGRDLSIQFLNDAKVFWMSILWCKSSMALGTLIEW